MNLLSSLRDTLLQLRKGESASEPVEKRRIYRVRCNLPVVVVVNEKEAVSGRLVNLSTTGMKIHIDRRLQTGRIYRLFVRARNPWSGDLREGSKEVSLRATAMWCKKAAASTVGYELGFLFFSFSGMRTDDVIHFFRDQLQVPVPVVSQKRRYTRIRRRFNIQMTQPQQETLTGSVRDLSMEGVQWIAEREFVEGSVVHLTISLDEDGPFNTEARIMRCRPAPQGETGFEVGAKFTSLQAKDHRKLAVVVNRYLKEQWGAG